MTVAFLMLACVQAPTDAYPCRADVVVVVGAQGLPEYGRQLAEWAENWKDAARRGNAQFFLISGEAAPDGGGDRHADLPVTFRSGETSQRDRLQTLLRQMASEQERELWLVLLGHGTFDGRVARFNLVGPDVSSEELAQWLAPLSRPVAVIQCASSSGPFLAALSKPGRVVITATRSGYEHSYARLGGFLSTVIGSPLADRDKDGQTSLLEAFVVAAEEVERFYTQQGRLATEHPLIDDNGDSLGTPADWFQGTRALKKPDAAAVPDGRRAHQFCLVPSEFERRIPTELRRRRDELESRILAWRDRKKAIPAREYLAGLEPLLLEMARLYLRIDEAIQNTAPLERETLVPRNEESPPRWTQGRIRTEDGANEGARQAPVGGGRTTD